MEPVFKDEAEVYAFIGERIRMMRTMQGVSQQKLAEVLGVSFQQVQKYESGANRVPVVTLMAIAKIFEVGVVWFLPMYSQLEFVPEPDFWWHGGR